VALEKTNALTIPFETKPSARRNTNSVPDYRIFGRRRASARRFRENPSVLRSLAGEAVDEDRRVETRPLDDLLG
jgi:hypothetical protein